jgi:diguanylate cyclase (GGDEF)-like protein
MEPSYLFSVLFFFSCVMSNFLGAYTLYLDRKAGLNKAFFTLCISLGIWAFGFSICVSAQNQELSLIWRRISVIGWGSFFSILLHFSIILTEKKGLLNKWWLYLLLYFPSVLTIYIYGISGSAESKYKLIHTVNGWINVPNSGFHSFFNYYYILFCIVSAGMIWLWGRKASSQSSKKKARLILSWIIATLIFASFTDIVASTFWKMPLPQLAPFIISMSLIVIYYAIKKYGLMKPEKIISAEETILNESTRGNIISYLAFALFACSLVNFASFFLSNMPHGLTPVILTSIAILFLGLVILFVKWMPIAENKKDITYFVICVLAIPIFTLRFIQTGSITIWAFPIIFVIIALVFNKRIILVALGISIISTQILTWILAPDVKVEINADDYFARIFLFLVFLWLASYVNKLYIRRLKENAEQMKLQKLISKISSDFITANQMNLEHKINQALEECGRFFEMDRSWIYLLDREQHRVTLPFVWYRHHRIIREAIECPGAEDSILMNQISEGKMIHTKSVICLPIAGNGQILGSFGIDSRRTPKKWREDQIDLLKVIANILGDALTRVQAEREIEQLAYYDHLTKLPNRVLFGDRVTQAIHQSSRIQKMFAVIFLDLDSFKTVNDTLGHEGGDELITEVGRKLVECIRKADTVSRFGGDEFLILLNNISDYQDVRIIADKIIGLFKEPAILRGQEFFVTASAGIALYPIDGQDTETLIQNSDIAMYKAKEKGKNQYALCSSEMKEDVRNNLILTNSLFRALERKELSVYYQPQVHLPEANIIGMEALLRWKHPELGMISPAVFIPIAEQSGIINTIGEWVLKTACRQNKIWQEKGYPLVRMSVNISVNQLRDPNIVGQIANVLQETGLKPEYLELEITEGSAINEANNIVQVLNDFKKLGITISIDDFGTEYSSLNRLKNLPIDRLKMDMHFVHGIEKDEKDRAITKVIINLAKNLDLEVIAEGVETEKQVKFLSQNMCNEVQGYYFYQPMPAEEIEELLRKPCANII